MLARTPTKVYVMLDAWASTIPHECRGCPQVHVHVGDLCAVPRCREALLPGEEVYAVIQHGGPDAPEPQPCRINPVRTTTECGHPEQWVCWRHVRHDGPISAR